MYVQFRSLILKRCSNNSHILNVTRANRGITFFAWGGGGVRRTRAFQQRTLQHYKAAVHAAINGRSTIHCAAHAHGRKFKNPLALLFACGFAPGRRQRKQWRDANPRQMTRQNGVLANTHSGDIRGILDCKDTEHNNCYTYYYIYIYIYYKMRYL